MSKNNQGYYRTMSGRVNAIKIFIYQWADFLSSYPRLLLEVFIRKNFGQRYFNFMSVITVSVLLALWPHYNPFRLMDPYGVQEPATKGYMLWYVFLAAFVLVSIKRYIEVLNGPSVYNFDKYSLYSGDTLPFFYNLNIGGKSGNSRLIETLLEPAPFFIAGLLLNAIGQKLGGLLMVSSVIYSLGYMGAYASGDNFIMDKIDEIICNEELGNTMVEGMAAKDTRYFQMRGKVPESKIMRRKIADMIGEQREPVEVE